MKPTYEVITTADGKETILRTDSDGKVWHIPTDPANSDYQAYLNKDKEVANEL
jgi:hypothetical protein